MLSRGNMDTLRHSRNVVTGMREGYLDPEAEQDRDDIWDYIAADNPHAAARMDELFSDAAAKLAVHSMLGREGRIPGTRELVLHESYCLVL